MLKFLLSALLVVSLASPCFAQDPPPCPFTGITTVDIEYSIDDYTAFRAEWNATECAIDFTIYKNGPYFIGNYYLTGHYIMYGDSLLDPTIPLDWPFYGHNILIAPIDILGWYQGGQSTIAPPYDANLIGMTIYIQAIATFITTVHFPLETEYALQHAMALTLY